MAPGAENIESLYNWSLHNELLLSCVINDYVLFSSIFKITGFTMLPLSTEVVSL